MRQHPRCGSRAPDCLGGCPQSDCVNSFVVFFKGQRRVINGDHLSHNCRAVRRSSLGSARVRVDSSSDGEGSYSVRVAQFSVTVCSNPARVCSGSHGVCSKSLRVCSNPARLVIFPRGFALVLMGVALNLRGFALVRMGVALIPRGFAIFPERFVARMGNFLPGAATFAESLFAYLHFHPLFFKT